MKYYLGLDEGTKWFYYLVKVREDDKAEKQDLDKDVGTTQFAQNLFSRESLGTRQFQGTYHEVFSVSVWSISEKEFKRLQEMNNLVDNWREYGKLAKYD